MEPEGSSPHSQEPATCPYPQPDQSSPRPTSHVFESRFNIIPHLRLDLPSGFLPSDPPHKNPVCISPPPIRATRPDHLILLGMPPIRMVLDLTFNCVVEIFRKAKCVSNEGNLFGTIKEVGETGFSWLYG
jgi:hypothetical protein